MKAKRIVYGCISALIFIALGLLLCCSASAQKQQKPGDVWRDPVLGMEFVWVPGGCYEMGCGTSDCGDHLKPVHTVCVDGFWVGKYEVTQGQWKKLMGDNPSKFKGCGDNCPVEKVSWHMAVEFAKRLSHKTGYTFRLPTEAQWEHACRSGGGLTQYVGGDALDAMAWYYDNSGAHTHPVGSKRANTLGIYDMLGNVWEWCQDWYAYYRTSPRDNPQGPASGDRRILRGGGYADFAVVVHCSNRSMLPPDDTQFSFSGFRLVRVNR